MNHRALASAAAKAAREPTVDRIIIEPVRHKVYDLQALLKGITPKNRHQAADFGPALGEEVW